MTKVFIGGSRAISRLSSDIRRRLDRIVEKQLQVLIGDANGADRAVQQYLKNKAYQRVLIFCTNGHCRNNLGNWPVVPVRVTQKKRDFAYFAAKDERMTQDASVGFMIWDGQSRGTEANIVRLLQSNKKVVVYAQPLKVFATLSSISEWLGFRSEALEAPNSRASHADAVLEAKSAPLLF